MDTNGVGKVLYLGDPKALKQLEAQAQEAHGDGLHITYSTIDSLEIMAGGVNKGVALSSLLERLGLTPADCLAFGDNLNDTEMLDLAGRPKSWPMLTRRYLIVYAALSVSATMAKPPLLSG